LFGHFLEKQQYFFQPFSQVSLGIFSPFMEKTVEIKHVLFSLFSQVSLFSPFRKSGKQFAKNMQNGKIMRPRHATL